MNRFLAYSALTVVLAASGSLGVQISAAEPLGPEDYEVIEGMRVTRAALPGLTRYPMAAAFDDRGRLFVAESAGVNDEKDELLENRPHFINLLTDTDGDGVFDRSTVFADGMVYPQGVLWVYDALYVMSPPSLWRLTDTNGDGVADRREELVTGFDFTGNAADVHGPFLHPNGRLYWCHGRKPFRVHLPGSDEVIAEGHSARIWSSTLDGNEVESFAGGGLDNPVEVDFTVEGDILGSVNLLYGRPRGDALVHWVHGGVYPRHDQGQVLAEFRRTGELLPEIHDFGHVAVSGLCRYRSGRLDASWRDDWFVTHFNTAQVTRTKIRRRGASFAEEETELFFRLLTPDAHLTDVLEDPNGDLLVVDTGGWFRRGCPNSQIAKPEVVGGIYRISRDDDGPYRAAAAPDWERLSSEAVADFLDHGEPWLQEAAVTELAVRGAPALPELERLLLGGETGSDGRRNAVWALTRMKFSEAVDFMHEALKDPDPGVRQAACNGIGVTRTWRHIAANQPAERQIELERNEIISGTLAGMVRSDLPQVAAAAATALGRMGETRAAGAVLGRLGRTEEDRFLEHALVYALIEMDDFEGLRPLLRSGDLSLIPGALRALSEMPSSNLEPLEVLELLDSESAEVRQVAVEVVLAREDWDAALANHLYPWAGELGPERREALSALVPPFLGTPPMRDLFGALLGAADDEDSLAYLLEFVAASGGADFASEWEPHFAKALAPESPEPLVQTALRALAAAPSESFDERLGEILADPAFAVGTRLAASRASRRGEDALDPDAFALALSVLEESRSHDERSEVLSILASATLTAGQRDRLAPLLQGFGPLEMASFHELFRRVDNEAQALVAAEAVAGSAGFRSLEINRLRSVFSAYPEALERIEARAAAVAEEDVQRVRRLDAIVRALPDGDAARGASVFASGKGACNVCHRVGDLGGEAGPDLTAIGAIRTGKDLVESILYPGESIARDYETTAITLKGEGAQVLVGVIREQDESSVTIVLPNGQAERVERSAIDVLETLPHSLMPDGLEHTMSEEDLVDLVAYLRSLGQSD